MEKQSESSLRPARRTAHLVPRSGGYHRLSGHVDPADALDGRIVSRELAALARREVVDSSSVVGASADDLGAILSIV
jgi:hypothetical protein